MFVWKATVVVMFAAAAMASPGPAAPGVSAQEKSAPVTVEGCLMREVDVPGRQPPEEQRSEAMAANNFVLTVTTMVTGTAPAGGTGPLMYKIQKLNKGELKKLANKRVQIDGTFDKVDRAKNMVMFNVNLVELVGTAIREVAPQCSAK